MTNQQLVFILGIIGLTAVNIAALRYIRIFGLFVTAGSIPLVIKLLETMK